MDFIQMGNTFIALLTRFVDSQERIAAAVEAQTGRCAGQTTEAPKEAAESPPAAVAATGVDMSNRDAVKAELDRRGVDYNKRCATATLADLLQSEMQKSAADEMKAPEKVTETKTEAATAAPSIIYKIEDVRAKLVALATTKGPEAARAIVVKYGASNLTTLPEEHYGDVMKDIEEVVANG
jgi:hypothetical protein